MLRVRWYQIISRVLGLSFGLRLMERGERVAEGLYGTLKEEVPELADLFLDGLSDDHEGAVDERTELGELPEAGGHLALIGADVLLHGVVS